MAATTASLGTTSAPSVIYTNLGPLTTVFTGPSSCATRTPIFSEIVDDQQNLLAADCFSDGMNAIYSPDYLTCQPSTAALQSIYSAELAEQTQSGDPSFTLPYYSPGISCPAGYQTATSFTLAASQTAAATSIAYIPLTGTHVVCCPSLYDSYNTDYGYCVSTATAATTVTNLCQQNCDGTLSDFCSTPAPFTWNPSQSSITIEAGIPAVYMVHQQTDVSSITTTSARATTSNKSTASTGAAVTGGGAAATTTTTPAAGAGAAATTGASASPSTKTGGAKGSGLGVGAMLSMAVLGLFAAGTCAL